MLRWFPSASIQSDVITASLNFLGRQWVVGQLLQSHNRARGLFSAAVDTYLDKFVQHTQFHFQMRQFVAFTPWQQILSRCFTRCVKQTAPDMPGAFRYAVSPRANPALTGTGIESPPLNDMLGIETCHLLREAIPLGRLSSPQGLSFAFTPIRKVCRLCTQLFGIAEGASRSQSSEVIFAELSLLGKQLNVDPTFNRCFDLPLHFEDELLRTRVLGFSFAADGSEDDTFDAAPHVKILP